MNLNKQKKPTVFYKVDWIGQDPNFMFSKTFVKGQEAVDLAKKNTESIAYKSVKVNDDLIKWQIKKKYNKNKYVQELVNVISYPS